MDLSRGKGPKQLIMKTWNRCKSLGRGGRNKNPLMLLKSKSWPTVEESSPSPDGCFSVYVGPEKQRFVIKTEYANHPLFRLLLDEAESEYGYSDGPIALPCDVDMFYRVLDELDGGENRRRCGFVKAHPPPYSPSRMVAIN